MSNQTISWVESIEAASPKDAPFYFVPRCAYHVRVTLPAECEVFLSFNGKASEEKHEGKSFLDVDLNDFYVNGTPKTYVQINALLGDITILEEWFISNSLTNPDNN